MAAAANAPAGEGEAADAAPPVPVDTSGLRPLSSAAEAPGSVDGAAEGRVFYGHDAFFLLLRLHRHLYERLTVARAAAAAPPAASWAPVVEPAAPAAAAGAAHPRFLLLLFRLLSGSSDQGAYEDDCRALLGANSFVLFTLDKLVYKVMKQAQAVLSDDTAAKLLALRGYEAARSQPTDAQFAANAGLLLAEEGVAFRFAASSDGARLGVQLLELSGDGRTDGTSGALEPAFADYLGSFLAAPAPTGHDGRPFPAGRTAPPPPGEEAEEAAAREARIFLRRTVQPAPAPGAVSLTHGLECKLAVASSKVSYVLDTEDVLRVKRPKTGGPEAAEEGGERLAAWLAGQEVAVAGGEGMA